MQVWDVTDTENYPTLGQCRGHKNAVLSLKWSADASSIFTASADKLAMMWDTYDFTRARTFKGHESHVNSIDRSPADPTSIVTGSDDCTVKLWDTRVRKHTTSFTLGFQVTAVAHSGDSVFFAGLDNTIRSVSLRNNKLEHCLIGHADMVTSLALPQG